TATRLRTLLSSPVTSPRWASAGPHRRYEGADGEQTFTASRSEIDVPCEGGKVNSDGRSRDSVAGPSRLPNASPDSSAACGRGRRLPFRCRIRPERRHVRLPEPDHQRDDDEDDAHAL